MVKGYNEGDEIPGDIPTQDIKIPIAEWDKLYYFPKGYVSYVETSLKVEEVLCRPMFPDFSLKDPVEIESSDDMLEEGFSKIIFLPESEGYSILVQIKNRNLVLTKFQGKDVVVKKQEFKSNKDLGDEDDTHKFLEVLTKVNGKTQEIRLISINKENYMNVVVCQIDSLICKMQYEEQLKLQAKSLMRGPNEQNYLIHQDEENSPLKMMKFKEDLSLDNEVVYSFDEDIFMVTFYSSTNKWYGISAPSLWELEFKDKLLTKKTALVTRDHFYAISSTKSYLCSLYYNKKLKKIYTLSFHKDIVNQDGAYRLEGVNLQATFLMEWDSFLVVFNQKYMMTFKPPRRTTDTKVELTYYSFSTVLNTSTILSNGELKGVVPIGKYMNALNLLIFDSDLKKHVLRPLEMNGLLIDCKDLSTETLLNYTIPMTVYYQNEEDILEPVKYTISFFDNRHSFSYILIAILGAIGCLLIWLMTFIVSRIKKVRVSQQQLKENMMRLEMSDPEGLREYNLSEEIVIMIEDDSIGEIGVRREPSQKQRLASFADEDGCNSTNGDFSYIWEDLNKSVDNPKQD